MNARFLFLLCLAALAVRLPARAADEPGDGTLHVLRPTIHAEQDKAELCLEFDHALEANDRAGIASAVKLESGGKPVPIVAQNVSVTNATLCLPSLDHRKEYRVSITGLHGAGGEKLTAPYSLLFTVPDRQPALAFSGSNDGIVRWRDNDPLLRAMNVARVHMELFRVSDRSAMIDAWRQRMQTTLAPSESATFAHDHGQSVWQDDLTLDDTPNKNLTPKISPQAADGVMPPGLYLIVATAVKIASKDADPEFIPVAAQWLLRSDLKIRAVRGTDGYYALAENGDGTAPAWNAHITAQDRDQKIIADARSDADGIATLPLPDDRRGDAALMIGQTDKGDIDFADLSPQDRLLTLPDMDASITADKSFYPPGGSAAFALAAHDMHGRPMAVTGSSLQILRPDAERSFYTSIPVPDLRGGSANITVPVPAINGLWPIVWQQGDGRVLAESGMRVTSNPVAPHIEITADRAMAADDGEINLTITSAAEDRAPAPYITGRITAVWTAPDRLFPGWDDFHFGNSESSASPPAQIASFITDENGAAQLHLNLNPPSDAAPLHAAILHVESDPVAGAADPAPITVPVRPRDYIVGVKPAAAGGRFAEDSLARFDVVALNGDGERRELDDLTYQIYEEGRSFEWYPDDGRWNYRPQQQQRRVSGGALQIRADGTTHIEWPVNAGSYRLDIANPNGGVAARLRFSAGWGASKADAARNRLALNPAQDVLHAGQEAKINFTLEQPVMITAIIADDHVRKIIHAFKPAGANQISFTPQDDWGERVSLSVDTGVNGPAGQLVLPVAHGEGVAKNKTADAAAVADADFTIAMNPPAYMKTGDTLALDVILKNAHAAAGSYHYSFSAGGGLKLSGTASGTVAMTGGQSKDLAMPVTASVAGLHELRLDIAGPHNFHLGQSWPVMAIAGDKALEISAAQTIAARGNWAMPRDKLHAKPQSGLIFLSPEPFYNLPAVLGDVLDAHPFTTMEIAGQLESMRLWREIILASGLMPEAMFEARRRDLLLRLLARQKADGSFPSLSDEDSEIINSSAALIALAPLSQSLNPPAGLPAAKPAVEKIVNWLHGRLSNTWFDEKERTERAKAYAALATADRLDMANLHYFSDTSAQKDLTPLADLQMAAAFAHNGDRDASLFWLNKANIQKASADIAPQLLTLLAENPYFDPHDLLPALAKLSHDQTADAAPDFGRRVAFLRALWNVTDRAGGWSASVNNADRNAHGVAAVNVPEKNIGFVIRNPMDRALYVAEIRDAQKSAGGRAAITRHIYRMNGAEITGDEMLDHRQDYLIVLEGPWVGDGDSLMAIHDDLTPAMNPAGCLLDSGLMVGDSLSWLRGLLLTSPAACEKSRQAIDALLKRGDKNRWRIAYLARADNGGSFNLSPPVARSIYGGQEILTGHADVIHIR